LLLLQITPPPMPEFDQAAEASRAYKHALATLATLTAHPPSYTHDPSVSSSSTTFGSLISSFFPNFQGQGPFGSAVRIAVKLQQRLWTKSTFGQLGNKRRKEEEIRGKAIKVKDLLQHSAELGNAEALYKLAHISLVRCIPQQVRIIPERHPTVSPKLLLSVRSGPCIQLFRRARLSDRERLLAGISRILSCNRLPRGGSREPSQSPIIQHVRRAVR
jgi:hypothetical protein